MILGCFWDPQRPERIRFRVRRSSKIKVFVLGRRTAKQSPTRPQNEAKIDPKTAPRGPQCRSEVLLDFRLNFSSDVERFGVPKGLPKGTQNRSKFALRAPGPPKGLQGPSPEASREPFWRHLGPPEAHFRTFQASFFEACARPTTRSKTLFGITSQRILCDRCGTDAHNTAGSVVGLGPQAHWRSGH